MGFFSDMSDDFNEEVSEVKPIVPSKEINNMEEEIVEEVTKQEELELPPVSDDDFDMEEIQEDMDEIFGEEEEDDSEDAPFSSYQETNMEVKKVAEVIEKVKKSTPVNVEAEVKKEKEIVMESSSNETVIASGVVVQGSVVSPTSVVVNGEITGNLKAKEVRISKEGKVLDGVEGTSVVIDGQVKGDTKGESIAVHSKITGNLIGTGNVSVGEKAVVVGNISAENLTVYGKVKGDLDCSGIVDLKTGAIVKGNIRALEVLIGKGTNFQGSIEKTGEIDDSLFE